MSKTTVPAAKFRFRAVELHELIIHKVDSDFSVTGFHYEIKVENGINREEQSVIISTTVFIYGEGSTVELGRINCECIFFVENFDDVVEMNSSGESFEILEPFAETVNSISISTTRGYMASELKGTVLQNAFLPIVDVKTLSKVSAR